VYGGETAFFFTTRLFFPTIRCNLCDSVLRLPFAIILLNEPQKRRPKKRCTCQTLCLCWCVCVSVSRCVCIAHENTSTVKYKKKISKKKRKLADIAIAPESVYNCEIFEFSTSLFPQLPSVLPCPIPPQKIAYMHTRLRLCECVGLSARVFCTHCHACKNKIRRVRNRQTPYPPSLSPSLSGPALFTGG